MEHTVLYKREGCYAGFPVLTPLPDGRLSVGIPVSPFHDHYAIGDWVVLVSEDRGHSWHETRDKTVPPHLDRHFTTREVRPSGYRAA